MRCSDIIYSKYCIYLERLYESNTYFSLCLFIYCGFACVASASPKLNLVRAVNRQPGLPPGMTRRALPSLLYTRCAQRATNAFAEHTHIEVLNQCTTSLVEVSSSHRNGKPLFALGVVPTRSLRSNDLHRLGARGKPSTIVYRAG